MLVRKSLFYVLLFFFMFNTSFVFLPFSTRVVVATFGIVVFIHSFTHAGINKTDFKCLLWFVLLLTVSLISTLINQEYDFSFFRKECVGLMIISFFGACLIDWAGRYVNFDLFALIKSYVNINLVQSFIIIMSLIIPGLKQYLISIQKWDERTEFAIKNGGRMCGLGACFDYGSALVSIALICTVFLYFIDNRQKPLKYVLMYIMQAIAALLLARSAIVGITCSIILFFVLDDKRNEKLKLVGRIVAIVGIVVMICFIFKSQLQQFLHNRMSTVMWVFEFFYSDKLAAMGKTTNSWTELSQKMYFIPENTRTWIIGDGRFTTLKGNPYMDTDPLYMRYLLFFGIPGVYIFFTFVKKIYTAILISSKNYRFTSEFELKQFRQFLSVILLFSLLSYLKSTMHCFYFTFYLLFFFKFYNKTNSGMKNNS